MKGNKMKAKQMTTWFEDLANSLEQKRKKKMKVKQIIEECSYIKTILIDYQDKTGVNVTRTIDRLANDTQIKIMKGVNKK